MSVIRLISHRAGFCNPAPPSPSKLAAARRHRQQSASPTPLQHLRIHREHALTAQTCRAGAAAASTEQTFLAPAGSSTTFTRARPSHPLSPQRPTQMLDIFSGATTLPERHPSTQHHTRPLWCNRLSLTQPPNHSLALSLGETDDDSVRRGSCAHFAVKR